MPNAVSRARARRPLLAEQLEDRRVLTGIPPTITLPGGGGGSGWSLDSTFGGDGRVTTAVNPGQNDLINAIAIQADGKTVAVGATNDGLTDDFVVARYLPDGTLDSSFGVGGIITIEFLDPDAPDLVNEMAMSVAIIEGTGQIVVGGQYDFSQLAIAWIDPTNGTVQQKFRSALPNSLGGAQLEGLAIDSNDHVVVVGPTANNADWFVARITPTGEFDPSFGNDEVGVVLVDLGNDFEGASDVLIQPDDGKIVVGGWTADNTSSSYAVVRMNADGTLDETGFGLDGIATAPINGEAQGIGLLSDGSIVLAGFARSEDFEFDIGLAKFSASGAMIFALTTDLAEGDDFGFDLTVQNGDKIVVAGSMVDPLLSSDPDFALVRYHSDGSLDESFAPSGYLQADFGGTSDRAFAAAVQADGKIVLGGNGGFDDLALARFASASGEPETFDLSEGETFTLTGSYTDPDGTNPPTITIDWGDGKPATLAILDAVNQTFSATYAYGDNSPLATPFVIVAKIVDEDGNCAFAETTAAVANVAPVAGPLTGPAGGVRYQALHFAGGLSDAGFDDTHEVRWDFGDGSFIDFTLSTAAGALTPQHTYTAAGVYQVTLTVRDDDGAVHSISKSVEIVAAQLQLAPCGCGQALFVGGTSGADNIAIAAATGGQVKVTINGAAIGTFAPTHGIVVYAGDGNDHIQVAAAISQSAWLYGGNGDDKLYSGKGPSVLLGGAGHDLLVGGAGRDLLIGGTGRDTLVGNGQEDILVAGYTDYDDHAVALCRIMDEWTSNKLYYLRVINLTGLLELCDPQNDGYFLNPFTVHDDGERDTLTGSGGLDWYFANWCLDDDSPVADKITDWNLLEIALDIDFDSP